MMSLKQPSVLILSGVRGDTRRYRTFHLYEQARLLGLECQLSHTTDASLPGKVERSNLVILHRAAYNRQIAWLEQRVHQKGGTLVQDIDDLLFEPQAFEHIHSIDFSDPVRASLYQQEMHLYRQSVELCDAATASTEYLAGRLRQMGKPTWVHRNAASLEMLALSNRAYKNRPKKADGSLVIGYASGTATHDQDFTLVRPALQSILVRYPQAQLRLVGPVDPGTGWDGLENRIQRIKLVPWRDLPAVLAQFDINLAPLLTGNPFGQSKSEIKYMEAALVHVPTIASPTEAFQSTIQPGLTGFLASDPAEWEQALEAYITQVDKRHKMGEAAWQDVLQRYHPMQRASELAATLSAILGVELTNSTVSVPLSTPQAVSPVSFWSSAQAEKSPNLLHLARYSLRYRGLPVLARQAWIYLRRLVSPLVPFRKLP